MKLLHPEQRATPRCQPHEQTARIDGGLPKKPQKFKLPLPKQVAILIEDRRAQPLEVVQIIARGQRLRLRHRVHAVCGLSSC